jgi:hypothetical protein
VNMRTQEENNRNKEKRQETQRFLLWFSQCLLVVVTSFGQGLHSTPL